MAYEIAKSGKRSDLMVTRAHQHMRNLKPYLSKALASFHWHLSKDPINDEVARVVRELREEGIATTSVEELGLDDAVIQQVYRECEQMASDPDALEFGGVKETDRLKKDYAFQFLGTHNIQVTEVGVLTQVALDPKILAIANHYLGCYARLNSYNVLLNVPTDSEPKHSQLWHRDPGDTKQIKMFLLVSALTPENGPFSYIPGSQAGGRRSNLDPPFFKKDVAPRTTDEQMRTVVPEAAWTTVVGDPGTIIVADSSGYHKGGFVRSGRRLLMTAHYTRRVYTFPPNMYFSEDLFGPQSPTAVRWATK